MIAAAYYVSRLQLPDFETPAIPTGYRLKVVTVSERHKTGFACRFDPKSHRLSRVHGETRTNEQWAIDAACESIIHDIGWSRARITLELIHEDGETEGSMTYDCDRDEWHIDADDPEAVQIGVLPTADDVATTPIHPLMMVMADESELLPVVELAR